MLHDARNAIGRRRPGRTPAVRAGLGVALALLVISSAAAQSPDQRLADLDRRLSDARARAEELQRVIDGLAAELRTLREAPASAPDRRDRVTIDMPVPTAVDDGLASYHAAVVRPDLGEDERGHDVGTAPELFVQSRFQAVPLRGASVDDAPTNFELTRMETRWSGRLSPAVGIGFELQYHPAPDGAAFEIVNDAFVEFYPSKRLTIRAGQFVKPFGFDILHSSSDRESPERGIFAGYFFPGQRDRGVMLRATVGRDVEVFAGAFNGNRFFTDRDRKLNYNLRVRKHFADLPLSAGVSAQLGHQLVPDGLTAKGREHLVGADVQWAWQRLGVRAEWMTGDRPSTLLELEPEFAPAYRPGARSSGGALFSMLRLTPTDHVYARYDRFNGDPVFGYDVRAYNVGYLRRLGPHARLGLDYQFKNRLTANDDALNSRLQISLNVER